MELIVMIVVAFPIGFLIRNRIAAYIAFIALHGFVFVFQSLMLVIEWVGGSKDAFGSYPKADKAEVWSYGAVNLVIFLVGLGLVLLGQKVASRRNSRAGADLAHT